MKYLIAFFLTCTGALVAYSQDSTLRTQFVADIVQFDGGSDGTKVEFQYAYPSSALVYKKQASGVYEGTLLMDMMITNGKDTLIDEWSSSLQSATDTISKAMFATGVRKYALAPGSYTMHLKAHDAFNVAGTLESTSTLVVKDFKGKIGFSDIMFLGPEVPLAKVDPTFTHGGLATNPSPQHDVFGPEVKLRIYAELYNTAMTNKAKVYFQMRVLDGVRNEMYVMKMPMKTNANGVASIFDLDMDSSSTGVYYLETSLVDYDTDSIYATTSDKFFVLNPSRALVAKTMMTEDEAFARSPFSTYTGKELELQLRLASVIQTTNERDVVEGCKDERCKQRFLFNFWNSRDPDQSTLVNERLEEFNAMYKRAQAFYASPAFPLGWSSDRGRTLLKYGVPNQIEQFAATMDTRPYEIWFYSNIQGGVYFYFVDIRQTNQHKLVHSTKNNEVRNEKWMDQYARVQNVNPNPESGLRPSTK